MKIIISFFIFCIVLFIYLHIQFHLKTSNDLEVYELDDASKDKLEEVCDVRQPVLFDFNDAKMIETTSKNFIVENYPSFEIKIRNTNDNDKNSELYVPLPLHASRKLFDEDKNACYFSENNSDFLNETGVVKNFKYNDIFLRPYMVSNMNYDIMMSSKDTVTPFRYENNYRNYFLCTQGSVEIKMTPPQSSKYLYTEHDYENFEFRSPVNPWNVQSKYADDFNKIKCLEISLTKGKIVYIPAYWWYSIKFSKDSSVSCFRYRTYFNNLAISPYIFMHILQLQNVKRETNNKIPIEMLQKTNDDSTILGNNNNNNNHNSSNHNSSNNDTKSNEAEPLQSNENSIQPNIDVDIVNTSTNIDNLAIL
jgi:hypothetical protein